VLEGEDFSEEIKGWIEEVIGRSVETFVDPESGDPDLDALTQAMQQLYASEITADELREDGVTDPAALVEEFIEDAQEEYAGKEQELGPELMRELERFVILQVVDQRWREHLENMDYLREGVHLRAMAQKDPLVEYTSEGHAMFQELNAQIREEVLTLLYHAQLQPESAEELQAAQEASAVGNGGLSYEHESEAGAAVIAGALGGETGSVSTLSRPQQRKVSDQEKIGRNDPCWCGSGKKYKKCHGA
jgi:preprotein translocase subunit SecA